MAAATLQGKGLTFTAENIRRITGDPEGHPNQMGAAINTLIRKGHIKPVGFIKAKREQAHARFVQQYV